MIKSAIVYFILLVAAATAQNFNPIVFPGVPSGPCSPPTLGVNTSNGDFYTCSAGVWVKVGSSGGGGIPALSAGQLVVGTSSTPVAQAKSIYDTRDWMTCDGITNASSGFGQLLSAIGSTNATIHVVGQCLVGSLRTPANVTLDFSSGGSLALIVDHTAPGGGAFIQGSGFSNPAASPMNSCSATLTGTVGGANHDILMMVAVYSTFGPTNARITSVTDGSNFYLQQHATTLGNAGYVASYIAASIPGGNVTVTANLSASVKNACIAWEISGLGPTPALDSSAFAYGTVTPFSSGAATLIAGDFVASYSEDPNDPQTCTAGAGYTQPAGLAGNVGTASANGPALCAEYIASGAGGSTSATQNFSGSPVLSSWVSAMIGLHPGSATVNILGGVNNPDKHQIFYNATGTNGVIDFTGNLAITEVDPEWWGASPSASAAVNTPAIQSSEYAAFGCGPKTCRVNGSGLSAYNKQWNLNGQYSINAEIQFYHVIGNAGARWAVNCKNNGGLTQTVANLRILDGQSDAYGHFDDCVWTGGAASTNALTDFDFSGVQGNDLRPQFLDFNRNTWTGNSQVATGLLLAKSGGGAQGSNIYCYDCEVSGFTTSGWQIGTPSVFAQNALDIGYSGDMQGNPQYGIAVYGGGYVSFGGSANGMATMENGFTTQTGFDMYCVATQGPCIMEHVRSESRKLMTCSTCQLRDVKLINQSQQPTPGGTSPIGSIFSGNSVTGDGAYYQVTVDAAGGIPFSGTGTVAAPILASSGSSTTIVNTNQTIAGATTIKTFTKGETVTQAVTGSTGTLLNVPLSTTTVTGSVTSGTITLAETMTQAVTGVTATEQPPTPTGSGTLFLTNLSGTADSTHDWVGGTSGAHYTPNAAPVFAPASPAMLITAATGAPDNTHNWTGGTSSAVYVPTAVPVGPNYTVNAFNGMLVGTMSGNNALCYGVVTANTATTITVAAGWITKYPNIQCPGPDNTSAFIVEPGWNHGTVVSGGMTLVYMNEFVIDGAFGTFEDVNAPGGQWNPSGSPAQPTIIRRGIVSRPDWYNQQASTPQARSIISMGSSTPLTDQIDGDWDVQVITPGANRPQSWSNLMIGGATPFKSASHRNLGSHALCWNAMTTGQSANEVCIGGRSDPAAGTSASRNIFEIAGGMIGRPTAFGTDQNGTATQIEGGLPTGAGTPGNIEFWLAPGGGGSSATPQSGALVASVVPKGIITKRFSVDTSTTLTSGAFTIGAGWGSTASIAITVTTSKDPAYVVTITTGGTGIVANPTLQITFADGTWTNVPACHQIQTGGNDIFGDVTVTARSATSYTYQWAGTPTTGKTYEFTQTCTGT